MEYTKHALSRIRQRKISKTSVENTLEHPDFSFVTRRGRLTALKRYGDKFLKVIYEECNDKIRLLQFIGQGERRMVRVEYDSKVDAMYIWLRKAKYEISEELAENVIIDLDKNGRIIGIEILDVTKNIGRELIDKILSTEKLVAATT
ncbi:MAG: DUF2283 domain-containing protein [Candidatus Bathyarchaeia archaeon]|nr:DUF2283 domain-containing protein [Candidatus Bathyarchaeia archaeon]